MKSNIYKLILAYLLMSIVISIGGYIFGLNFEKSIKIGFFTGLYVFLEHFFVKWKKS